MDMAGIRFQILFREKAKVVSAPRGLGKRQGNRGLVVNFRPLRFFIFTIQDPTPTLETRPLRLKLLANSGPSTHDPVFLRIFSFGHETHVLLRFVQTAFTLLPGDLAISVRIHAGQQPVGNGRRMPDHAAYDVFEIL